MQRAAEIIYSTCAFNWAITTFARMCKFLLPRQGNFSTFSRDVVLYFSVFKIDFFHTEARETEAPARITQ